jgi:hypothetical protein
MSDHSARHTLLQELDARQDDVLRQLEELNSRIESLLKTCLSERERELAGDRAD